MKNKLLIGVLTFFVTIILMILTLNIFDSESKKDFSFDRKFRSKTILKLEKKFNKTNQYDHVVFVKSDTLIVERDRFKFNEEKEKNTFYFENFNFKDNKELNAILPFGANILFCDLDRVIYTKKFNIFQYNFESKLTKQLIFKNLKINCINPTLDSPTKFLCLAEHYIYNKFKTGFFIIDLEKNEFKISNILESNDYEKFLSNSLRYIGKFLSNKEKRITSYYCEKYSKVYFFDSTGLFLKELQTEDKVPLPKIAKNKEGNSFYSRDGTWYSNMGIFFKNNDIFIFSGVTKDKNCFTIDKYSWDTMKYTESYKLQYNNLTSNGIYNMYLGNNRVILCFDYDYASFQIR